jgi:hypothetical protein
MKISRQFGGNLTLNIFFYFSNKNITGVDAKILMKKELKALVTLSHNTKLRDMSQGIYRMRKINLTQTADIFAIPNIANDLFSSEILKSDKIIRIELTLTKIIEILKKNDYMYFQNQEYYFNLQKIRYIDSSIKKNKNHQNPYLINNNSIKITEKYQDYAINKLMNEINEIFDYINDNRDFIAEFITTNYQNIIDINETVKLDINKFNNKISIQNQLNTNVNTNTQSIINLNKSRIIPFNIFRYFNNFYVKNTYGDYLFKNNITSKSFKQVQNNFNIEIFDMNIELHIKSYNYQLLLIYVKNQQIIIDNIINVNNAREYLESKCIKFTIFDIYGTILYNNNILTEYEKIIIENCKYLFKIPNFLTGSIFNDMYILSRNEMIDIISDRNKIKIIEYFINMIDPDFMNNINKYDIFFVLILFIKSVLLKISNKKINKQISEFMYNLCSNKFDEKNLSDIIKKMICYYYHINNKNNKENNEEITNDIDIFEKILSYKNIVIHYYDNKSVFDNLTNTKLKNILYDMFYNIFKYIKYKKYIIYR